MGVKFSHHSETVWDCHCNLELLPLFASCSVWRPSRQNMTADQHIYKKTKWLQCVTMVTRIIHGCSQFNLLFFHPFCEVTRMVQCIHENVKCHQYFTQDNEMAGAGFAHVHEITICLITKFEFTEENTGATESILLMKEKRTKVEGFLRITDDSKSDLR